ncbi:hypothetical protein [Algoriphagus sp. AGSA1]|uniref:hypothetical protein n=1 Tax=Algoriphagus sp. AGSA1 TaxID=2907213 RepID=UPI001F3B227B|nr:hypothetical protein [Algoriphagus sp. AGSA1]
MAMEPLEVQLLWHLPVRELAGRTQEKLKAIADQVKSIGGKIETPLLYASDEGSGITGTTFNLTAGMVF